MIRQSLLVGTAIAAMMSTTAWAQGAGDNQIEELVVTARKTQERAQDVPVAITAISETRMRDLSIANFSDVARSTPNLFVTRYNSNPASPLITIRGQAQQDVVMYFDPPVGVYVDSVYLPHSFGLDATMIDVARIEVLKGPQGTLYGKNTTGGALNVITKEPNLGAFGGYANVVAGNYDHLAINAVLNVPIVEDKLGLRLVASNMNHNAYGRDGRGGPVNDDHSRFYRAKILWQPTEQLRVRAGADYQRLWNRGSAMHVVEVNPYPNTPPITNTPATATAFLQIAAELGLPNTVAGLTQARNVYASYVYGQPNGAKRFWDGTNVQPQEGHFDGWGVYGDISYDVSDVVSARSITSYRKFQRRDLNELDASPFTLLYADNQSHSKFLSEEFQVLGKTERYNWIVGAWGAWEDADELNGGLGSISVPAVNPNNPSRTLAYLRQTSWAVFGQGSYSLTEQLRLTAGLRWTSETKKNTSRNVTANPPRCNIDVTLRPNAAVCEAIFKNTYDDYSYTFSLDYKPIETVLLYAKTSRGFKGGGQNARGTTPATFQPFEPETVTDYEVGLKSDWLDRTLRINAAYFHSDYKNIQRSARVLASTGAVISLITNATSGKINGGELEVTWRPIRPLTLNFAGGITDAKYDKFIDAALGDRTNEPFALPKKTWSVSGTYAVPTEVGELRIAADYNWRDKVIFAPAAVFKAAVRQPSYGILNARIGLNNTDKGFEVAAFVKNATAKKYYVATLTLDNSLGYDLNFVGNPRTYGIELTKKFGGSE